MASNRNKLKFEKVFKFADNCLWINGSHPALPRDMRWALKSFATLSLSFTLLFLLSNSIINYRIPNKEFTDVVRESIIATLAFTLICKYVIIVYNRNIVFNLIRYINDDYELSLNFSEEEIVIINKYIKKSRTVIKFWIMSTALTLLLFIFKAFGGTTYQYIFKGNVKYVPLLDMILPPIMEQHKNEFVGYILITTMVATFGLYAAFVYNGFEPLIPIFLLHCCGQLEIISLRMKNIFKQNASPEEIYDKIKEINIKLQSIYKFVHDVQITFVPLFEFTMKSTTFVLPFTAFEIVQSIRRNQINMEFLSLLSCAMFQFFMPCYHSDFLMEKSEHMRQGIYFCGWESQPNIKIRKLILFMLTRTVRPVVLNTFFLSSEPRDLCRDGSSILCHIWYFECSLGLGN